MRLFIYDWNFFTKKDLYHAFSQQRIELLLFHSSVSPRVSEQKEKFRSELKKAMDENVFDAVFSINYQEELAEEAHERSVPYICWTYDSPALGGIRPALKYDTNYLFLFDSYEYEQYQDSELPHLFYLPLAVDVNKLNRMQPTPLQRMKYHADVSLVGQLYQSDMDKIFPLFDEYGAGYIASMINTQLNIYGADIISELVNENVIQRICNEKVTAALLKNINDGFFHDVNELKSYGLSSFLLKAVTNKERVLLLTLLARYFNVKLYCPGKPEIPNVLCGGIVDYETEMPIVFKCSKINLNVTLRNIRSGIPQRVVDILGCRGLALTNYQKDIEQYFEAGKHLLVYHSVEEALDQCRFYLKNEREAEKIRQNGYKLVKDEFNYEKRLSKIWELSGLKSKVKGEM